MAKTPTEIKALARQHTPRAIEVLQGIMDQPKSGPAARIAAATALLDRAYGRPAQTIAGDAESPLTVTITSGVPRPVDAITDGKVIDVTPVVVDRVDADPVLTDEDKTS